MLLRNGCVKTHTYIFRGDLRFSAGGSEGAYGRSRCMEALGLWFGVSGLGGVGCARHIDSM